MTVAGFTSTGSKRPAALFGQHHAAVPGRMISSSGCMITTADGQEYLDFIMALGAVLLGYGHPGVDRAAVDAIARGTVGSLSPEDERLLAEELRAAMPQLEQVRFLKTGAEAVAAAVRIARVLTGRGHVLGCGYHGWLDWCSRGAGIPASEGGHFAQVPFNDAERAVEAIRSAGDRLACVVIEPVVEAAPTHEWLAVLRAETRRVGALLVFDEVKTAFRVGPQGAAGRWGGEPDLCVIGKALANGFPLAAVGGSREVMTAIDRTWISSTAATEFVSLAAARAAVAAMRDDDVSAHVASIGTGLIDGLGRLAITHQRLGVTVRGIAEMCYLHYASDDVGARVAVECARRGLLFKRSAYNFVSLAHDATTIDRALSILDEAMSVC